MLLQRLLEEKLGNQPYLIAGIIEACKMAVADSDSCEDLANAVGEEALVALKDSLDDAATMN